MTISVDSYYAELRQYGGLNVAHETALRSAMQSLLGQAGREVGWTLVPEQPLANGKRPDGTFRDGFNLARGYWEAKDTGDDLETEIKKKINLGYPLDNMLFEDTRRAVLFQGRDNRNEFDLTQPAQLRDMLRQFTAYAAPDIETFHQAVSEFQARIPELAEGLKQRIETERQESKPFATAFDTFHDLCRAALNPQISAQTIEEMLVQHLLTERLFRTIFDNPDFTRRNVIAAEIEKVIDALTRRAFNRQGFLKSLDRFYVAIENAARSITDWNEKQGFLNQVYERFFQGFSIKQADTHGIVYTPQEIVGFMCASVEHILKTEFGKSLSTPGVQILDPCTGTGNFVVNLLRHHISRRDMKRKYAEDIFANEIMLLPYYIASLNIEHEYFAQSGEYLPFEGLCFTDTLALAEGQQLAMFAEENSGRTQREQDAPITVILGNPPYNARQMNENDNNKNRAYKVVDNSIAESYSKHSKASNKNVLNDAYVKFFRWATNRLQGQDGIVAFVTNNGFLSGFAFDGMRKVFLDEFTSIYHLDCGGNVRKNPRLSGTTHNVFGIQVGVGITILVRRQTEAARTQIFYHALPPMARASEKLKALAAWGSVENINWSELTPDAKQNWLTEGMQADFESFLPIGTKDAKASRTDANAIFRNYGRGVATSRDSIVYDFHELTLTKRTMQFIEDYNAEIDRYLRVGRPKDVDGFVGYDNVKWSESLKANLVRAKQVKFDKHSIRKSQYRPFLTSLLYFDPILNERQYQMPVMYPTTECEHENTTICVCGAGNTSPASAFASNCITDLNFLGGGSVAQWFPFYVYDEDGTNRRENITDWALAQFREAHGADVTKWDIFHYVYALLHDPAYRTRYAENLKRELPRIPIEPRRHGGHGEQTEGEGGENSGPELSTPPSTANASPLLSSPSVSSVPSVVQSDFRRYVRVGAELLRLHRDYETADEYPLQSIENREVPFSWRVEKMKLSKDKTQIVVNDSLTLGGIPPECFAYRLGNRSALEWVLDQYQVTTDKRSGLVSDPNRPDDEEYIVRLVGKVIAVSLQTVKLVAQLRGAAE